jgi:hypothetical protein
MDDAFKLMAAHEIRELKARYFSCLDGKDWVGFRSVFADDAEFDMRDGRGANLDPEAVYRGADAIASFVRSAVDPLHTQHRGNAEHIDILSPVTARATWLMEDELEAPDGAAYPFKRLHGCGHYHETYRRERGRWVIGTLKLTRLWVRVDHD